MGRDPAPWLLSASPSPTSGNPPSALPRERPRKQEFVRLIRQITNNRLTRPGSADTLTEWQTHVPRFLRNRRHGMPADDVAACLAADAPELGIRNEDDFYQYCREVWN